MWVRPDLTTSAHCSDLRVNEPDRRSSAGSSSVWTLSTAARWTALGNTSLDDWPMFTWSLGCTSSPARLASTSLAFVFDDVPEPVWKTSIGNWSSWRPSATSSPARPMRSPSSASSSPSSAFTRAAAALMRPSQWTTGVGTGSPDTWKLSIALLVSEPQSCWCTSVAMWPRLSPGIGYICALLHRVRARTRACSAPWRRARSFRVLIAGRDGSHPNRPVLDLGRRGATPPDSLLQPLRPSQ